jgi:hypothetical protein
MLRSAACRALPALAFAMVLGSGCFTTGVLSSPNVMPEGDFAYTIGITKIDIVDMGSTVMGFRFGLGEGFDAGASFDQLTAKADIRYQFLKSEEHFVDATVELGTGAMFFSLPIYYVGVGFGLDFGSPEGGISPYVNYRWTGLSLLDMGDLEGEDDDGEFDFTGLNWWGQVTVGVELRLSKGLAIIPEVSWIQELESALGEKLLTYSVAVRISKF